MTPPYSRPAGRFRPSSSWGGRGGDLDLVEDVASGAGSVPGIGRLAERGAGGRSSARPFHKLAQETPSGRQTRATRASEEKFKRLRRGLRHPGAIAEKRAKVSTPAKIDADGGARRCAAYQGPYGQGGARRLAVRRPGRGFFSLGQLRRRRPERTSWAKMFSNRGRRCGGGRAGGFASRGGRWFRAHVDIDLEEAINGAKMRLPFSDGRDAGHHHSQGRRRRGKTLRLKGQGGPPDGPGPRGRPDRGSASVRIRSNRREGRPAGHGPAGVGPRTRCSAGQGPGRHPPMGPGDAQYPQRLQQRPDPAPSRAGGLSDGTGPGRGDLLAPPDGDASRPPPIPSWQAFRGRPWRRRAPLHPAPPRLSLFPPSFHTRFQAQLTRIVGVTSNPAPFAPSWAPWPASSSAARVAAAGCATNRTTGAASPRGEMGCAAGFGMEGRAAAPMARPPMFEARTRRGPAAGVRAGRTAGGAAPPGVTNSRDPIGSWRAAPSTSAATPRSVRGRGGPVEGVAALCARRRDTSPRPPRRAL